MVNYFISIIIPTFNSEKFLTRTLNSLKYQEYQNFETIIIDNSSSDKTDSIVKKYSLSLDIKFIKVKNEGIIARSRNKGINQSKGSIICFLDSDDFWDKKKLLRINEVYNKEKFDVCCHNEIAIDQKGSQFKYLRYKVNTKDLYQSLLTLGNCLSTSAVSIKRDYLIKKNLYFSEKKDFITAEDYDLWLNLAKKNAKFLFLEEYLGFYQFHNNSNSNQNLVNHLSKVDNVIFDHLSKLNNKKLINLVKLRLHLSKTKLNIKKKKI